MSDNTLSRRQLFGTVGAAIAGSSAARAQSGTRRPAAPALTIDSGPRVAPVNEITMVPEFEDSARLTLPAAVFETIAGTERQALDRISLRSRMLIPTQNMDLSVDLFGDKLFTPIMIGPVSDQKRYHADAELGTVRGAAAGQAAVVISSRSSVPIEQLAAEARSPLWYQVWTESDASAQIKRAVSAGVRAVVVTLGPTQGGAPGGTPNWAAIEALQRGAGVPLLVKGVLTPAVARLAVQRGVQGIIVSNPGRPGPNAPILALPAIVDEVGGKVPVLVDGSFRLGPDVYKALAYGAKGVLIGRPAMWALSAHGAAGVQTMLEILQAELAQTMSACSNPNLQSLDRNYVKLHAQSMS